MKTRSRRSRLKQIRVYSPSHYILTKEKMESEEGQYIYGLLLKEKFREAVRREGIAKFCVIDMGEYSHMPDKVGCFWDNGKWVVYETDYRGECICEDSYPNALQAYKDLAERANITFSDKIAWSRIEFLCAYLNAKKVAEAMKGTKTGDRAEEDMCLLNRVRKEEQKAGTRNTTKQAEAEAIITTLQKLQEKSHGINGTKGKVMVKMENKSKGKTVVDSVGKTGFRKKAREQSV